MVEPLLEEILKWVEFAKGGPGSGAQPGHNFNGNQWGNSGYHTSMASAHRSDAAAARSLQESVLSPENLHRDGEATPSQVARGRALGAALGKEATAHDTAATAHDRAADSAEKMNDAAGQAGGYLGGDRSDDANSAHGDYAEAKNDYTEDELAATKASANAVAAGAEAGK